MIFGHGDIPERFGMTNRFFADRTSIYAVARQADGEDLGGFQRPGGFLYLDVGLLKDPKQLDKAYFAVAHEVAHVLKRHETRELQGLIIDAFETAEDLKLIANATRDPEAILAKIKLNKDQYTRHHMDQELQADACAARVLGDSYLDDPKLARTIRAFLKELLPPTKEEARRGNEGDGAEGRTGRQGR